MPKYWGKQNFSHGSFPEVGEKQKADGATTDGAQKPSGPKKVGENNSQLRFRHHG